MHPGSREWKTFVRFQTADKRTTHCKSLVCSISSSENIENIYTKYNTKHTLLLLFQKQTNKKQNKEAKQIKIKLQPLYFQVGWLLHIKS